MCGAAWLRRATEDGSFLDYIQNNGKTLGAEDNINEFGWDNKHAGLNVLVSKVSSLASLFFIYFSNIKKIVYDTHDHIYAFRFLYCKGIVQLLEWYRTNFCFFRDHIYTC